MKKFLAILGLCAAAAACSQTRVVHDNSVGAKFAAFNRSGWSVSNGGASEPKPPSATQAPGVKVISSSNPLSNPVWKTNFQVDPDAGGPAVSPGGFTPPPPATPGSPLLGGYVLPKPTGAQPATQPALVPR